MKKWQMKISGRRNYNVTLYDTLYNQIAKKLLAL